MRIVIYIAIAVCLLAAAGCGGSASVKQDWDPDYDFSDIGSYGWLPLRSSPNIGEKRLKRLVAAIDAEMAAKGMKLTADDPKILLVLHVISETRLDLEELGYAAAQWDNAKDSDLSDKGTIMVDVVDGEAREMVWRAIADGKVDPSATAEEQNKRFTKLAKKLFEKFPPPAK